MRIFLSFIRAVGIIIVAHALGLRDLHCWLFMIGTVLILGTVDDGGLR